MKRRLRPRDWLILVLVVALPQMGPGGCHRRPAEKQTLSVYGPCFLSQPLRQIGNRFESQHPNLDVRLKIDKPGAMVRQVLEKGERPSVFVSLGEVELQLLEARGLVRPGQATRFAFSDRRLGLIVPQENPAGIERIEDLAADRVQHVVLHDPETTTIGHRVRQAFQRLGLWERIEPKVLFAEPDRMFLTYLTEGKAEAAVVYQSCLFPDYEEGEEKDVPSTIKLITSLPEDLYDPIPCYAALLEGTEGWDLAQSFVTFLAGAEAQPIWAKHHFTQGEEGD